MTNTKYQPSAYQKKLLDPRWQKKRLGILDRAKFKCEICDDGSSTLHVHHGYYERGLDPWEYDDDTLHCLCESCHKSEQDRLRDIHRDIAELGPGYDDLILMALHTMKRVRHCGISDHPELELEGAFAKLFVNSLFDPGKTVLAYSLFMKIKDSFDAYSEYVESQREFSKQRKTSHQG